jgi:hypothetical protein
MPQDRSSLHIITPVEHPEEVLEQIAEWGGEADDLVVLDLSVGTLIHPSSLRERGTELSNARDDLRWVDGQKFAAELGDSTRETYLEWLSEIADRPLLGGASIKEWFTYRGELSLWWFTPMGCKNWETHPYRWMFYMMAAVDRVLSRAPESFGDAHVWTGRPAAGRALEDKLSQWGVSAHIRPVAGRGDTWSDPTDRPEGKNHRIDGRRMLEAAQKLIEHTKILIRQLTFSWTTLRNAQKSGSPRSEEDDPLVLVHSQFPRSWRPREGHDAVSTDVRFLDHYFGDAPFRWRRMGMEVAWLPTVRWSNYDEWVEKRAGPSLGSALPWMTVDVGQVAGLLFHQVKWAIVFLFVFAVKRIQKEWRYEGVRMGTPLFDEFWDLCIRGEGMMGMLKVERYRSACSALRPDAVLYRDEFYKSGRLVSAGTGQTTHRVGVQHGILNREHTTYQFRSEDLPTEVDSGNDRIHSCPVPDRLLGFGEYVREQFGRWDGYNSDRVIPVGSLRHDSLAETVFGEESSLLESANLEFGLPQDEPVVLVCPGRSHETGLYFEMVLDGLEETSHGALTAVKVHQFHGGEESVHRIAQRRGVTNYSVLRSGVYRLLARADVLVVGTSTLAVESLLLGTPVVSIVAHPEYELYPFTQENIAWTVSAGGRMGSALQQALECQGGPPSDRSERRERLRRHLHNGDANACGRVNTWLREKMRD